LKYEVAARNNDVKAELPDSNGNLIQFLERDAILIRKDHKLDVIRKQEANFTVNLTVPLAGQPFTLLRGWSSIDVKIDGQVFRMINTRLDPSVEAIRNAQALEIIQGPANTSLPVVITGDLNAPPNSSTYNLFINAGFKDTWNIVGEGPGFTHEQSPDLLNANSKLIERFDYILFKNGWEPIEAELVGESQNDRTKTGLWPSDHAGVSAKLNLEHHHNHHHEESSD
jgi:endonuclease/exonuclease/phosphatase family metal-dependent hydrolase